MSSGTYSVPEGVSRRPIDGVLRSVVPDLSWGGARALVDTGKVRVDGNVVIDSRHPVSTGQEIMVTMNAPRPETEQRLSRDAIVFADPHVVVVRKPPGISTVPFDEGERGTLDQLVRALLSREGRGKNHRVQGTLGVVHRLDKETTGLLVFARTLAAKKHLAQQFRDHTVHRRYIGVAHGTVPSGTHSSRFVADRGDGLRGSTEFKNLGVPAVTHVEALDALGEATVIACRLETGRTHQIRIHLSESGHPLVGERVYVRRYAGAILPAPRILLHAAELGFIHPQTEREMRFEQPIPEDMSEAILMLRQGVSASPPKPAPKRHKAGPRGKSRRK